MLEQEVATVHFSMLQFLEILVIFYDVCVFV